MKKYLNQSLRNNQVIIFDSLNRPHKCRKLKNNFFEVINSFIDNEVTTLLNYNIYHISETTKIIK